MSRNDDTGLDTMTLSMQPRPTFVRVVHLPLGRPTSTAVNRGFDPAEVGRCTLCRSCTANALGTCMVGINRVVTVEEARYLSDRDCDWYEIAPRPSIRALSS